MAGNGCSWPGRRIWTALSGVGGLGAPCSSWTSTRQVGGGGERGGVGGRPSLGHGLHAPITSPGAAGARLLRHPAPALPKQSPVPPPSPPPLQPGQMRRAPLSACPRRSCSTASRCCSPSACRRSTPLTSRCAGRGAAGWGGCLGAQALLHGCAACPPRLPGGPPAARLLGGCPWARALSQQAPSMPSCAPRRLAHDRSAPQLIHIPHARASVFKPRR